jgi:hypothetical protein
MRRRTNDVLIQTWEILRLLPGYGDFVGSYNIFGRHDDSVKRGLGVECSEDNAYIAPTDFRHVWKYGAQ